MRAAMDVMLSIAIPLLFVAIVFAIFMGSFITQTITASETYVPYKVASMVLHSLTGDVNCLALNQSGTIHKGLLNASRIEQFGQEFESVQPNCSRVVCQSWRAIVTFKNTLGSEETYQFGDNSTDENLWRYGACSVGGNYIEKSENSKDTTCTEILSAVSPSTDSSTSIIEYHKKNGELEMPIVVDDDGYRTLGRILVEVAPLDPEVCSEQVNTIIQEYNQAVNATNSTEGST